MRNFFTWNRSLVVLVPLVAAACGGGGSGLAPAQPLEETPTVLSADTPIAVTEGRVQGSLSETNPDIITFKGVPYAAPPVGDLRWKPPVAVEPWDDVRDATVFGNRCVQGGGYTGGTGSYSTYEGTQLAARGVVLVSINYRLNVFGFYAHPALSAESPYDASGNQGIQDMVASLVWVQDNIASFDGDPRRVTIFGESAGAGAVMSLMVVPQAEGLYHGAIAESN